MLRSYLRLAVRTLRRRTGYAVINAVGLVSGLAVLALVAVFIQHESTYDAHHEDADRTYRITRDYRSSTYSTISFEGYWRADPQEQRALATTLPEAVPGIEQATNFEILSRPLFVRTPAGAEFEPDRYLMTNTGAAFLDVFTFDVLRGAQGEALTDPYSVVLTQSTARRYFGDANPVGQSLQVDTLTATVTSVIPDPPSNSRITFDFAMSVRKIPNWGAFHYVRLREGANPTDVAPQISDVMDRVDPRRVEDSYTRANQKGESLQALTDIHFAERYLYDDTPHRDVRYLWAFAAIGLLILGITTINYANLSIALLSERNAEMGVRKALGAHRRQVVGQLLTEAVLLALVCLPLALLTASVLLPGLNALMDLEIARSMLVQPWLLGLMVLLAVGTGLAAGGYPAIALARREAADLFDESLSQGRTAQWSLRHGLIVLQFSVLIGLGSLSYIVNDQVSFMVDGNVQYRTDDVVSLTLRGDSLEYQQLRQRVLASSSIRAVGTGVVPSEGANRGNYKAEGGDVEYEDGDVFRVDVGWFDVMGIEHPVVQQMRDEGPGAPQRFLINEAAAERLGWEDPVGKTVILDPQADEPARETVAGVLPNLLFRPMRDAVLPTFIRVSNHPGWAFQFLARFAPGRTDDGMARLRDAWAEVKPDTPMQSTFLDTRLAEIYEQERRFGNLALFLTGLAVLLAILGLVGLTAYLTRMRMKEISVRKVLGASTRSIVVLLNREFVLLVGVALCVGGPLAYVAAQAWLDGFAYRIDVPLWIFGLMGVAALTVALGASSMQSIRAARTDPAKVLRTE